jgi:alanine dehydrogenase
MVRLLTDEQVDELVTYEAMLPVVGEALRKQGRGEVERPPSPHFPVGVGLGDRDPDESTGNGRVMPAHVHGSRYVVTKLVGVHDDNVERGLPAVVADIVVVDAAVGGVRALMDATRLTDVRTGCIGGLAARELGPPSPVAGVFGAGPQAHAQTRAVEAAVGIDELRAFSPSDSKYAFAQTMRDEGIDARAVDSPAAVVDGAEVVVTATNATEPVFDGTDLDPGTLVVAVGAYSEETRELDGETVRRAARVFADVPPEVAETGDILAGPLDETDLVPFPDVLAGTAGRESADETLVVESIGSAVMDAAAAEHVLEEAEAHSMGTTVDL